MLELNSTYPDQEDLTIAFNRAMAGVRDNLADLEILFKQIFEGRTYIDEEDTAKLLHCKISEIPQRLPRYRASRIGYLYKVKEVIDFIESKRIGGK